MITRRLAVSGLALSLARTARARQPLWLELSPTPKLPKPERSGYASVNGIKLWHAVFGQGDPVIFLHGGLANADYWGLQIPQVAQHHQVIVMDSRGHGRSTRDNRP